MLEAKSTPTGEIPLKPVRKAAFNMAEILSEANSRPIGWIEHVEELGRRYNPKGAKRHLTVERVNEMMRGRHMP
jgi:hypothetical protein